MGRLADFFLEPQPQTNGQKPTVAASTNGTSPLAEFTVPNALFSRALAQSVPTVNRATDLLKGTTASLPFKLFQRQPIGVDDVELEPRSWFDRPDSDHTRSWLVAWTVDDLFHYGRAYWLIRTRFADGFAASFQRIPFDEAAVRTDTQDRDRITQVTWRGRTFAANDVVIFDGLTDGILSVGWRAISIAIKLDEAANRFASNEVPSGWLQQTSGEPLNQQEGTALADEWQARRSVNTTAFLGLDIDYNEATYDPERLQLIESRQHQALELSRLANVPPWTTGAPQGASMTYANAMQARLDLIDFGALPFALVIEETLSGPKVLPRGQYIKLDTDAWLRNPLLATPGASTGAEGPPEIGDEPKSDVAAPQGETA